jgi:hypothetical protein
MVALGGVVVHDVEDHLDARGVQGFDHGLELSDLLSAGAAGRIGVVRGEEADRVVAPVVGQAPFLEHRVMDELVDGHELDGRDPQVPEVADDRRMAHAGVGAAHLLGDLRVEHRHALDVGLVDDRLRVVVMGAALCAPVEVRADDHRHEGVVDGVLVVGGVRGVEIVGVQRVRGRHRPVEGLGVGIEQELRRIAPRPRAGVEGPVDAVAVPLSRSDAREVDVPHVGVDLGHLDSLLSAPVVEQAQLDAFGDGGEQREVRPRSVEGRAERGGGSRPGLHATSFPRPALVRGIARVDFPGRPLTC